MFYLYLDLGEEFIMVQPVKSHAAEYSIYTSILYRDNFSRSNLDMDNFSRSILYKDNFSRSNLDMDNFSRFILYKNNFSRSNLDRDNFSRFILYKDNTFS